MKPVAIFLPQDVQRDVEGVPRLISELLEELTANGHDAVKVSSGIGEAIHHATRNGEFGTLYLMREDQQAAEMAAKHKVDVIVLTGANLPSITLPRNRAGVKAAALLA